MISQELTSKKIRIPIPFAIPVEIEKELPIPKKNLNSSSVRKSIKENFLNTVCEESLCPNLNHCWSMGTATYLIMGDRCTRRCGFCNIQTAKPLPLDPTEPMRLANSVREMKLKHVVITSVDRDDLKDGGSAHFASCIREVKKQNPQTTVEVLIPDFKGKEENLQKIWNEKPEIIAHNIETVPSLFREICPQSNYQISLKVLESTSKAGFLTKTSLILGLGETLEEVKEVIQEAKEKGVHILAIGQYLPPTQKHAKLKKLYPEEVFFELKDYALKLGYLHVESGSLVRSSYNAGIGIHEIIQRFYHMNA
ncbi:MAG: lipoyl synthase [Leptospiraceae bacterium]|nr:lipoyl synthase [Leptospiraceae bacterium]MDW7976451.1 lipoyl synthase [Leptospiraceae bacterium]